MNSMSARIVCRVLAACMAVAPLQAGAGLIGTGDAVAPVQVQAGARAALAGQFEALGVAADSARDRVAALSDAEVAQLAGQVERQPAGAMGGAWAGALLVVIFLIWRFQFSDQAKAEAAAKKAPAK
jgi:hypothetical protein